MNASKLTVRIRQIVSCDRGANLVEYIILVGVVAVLCVAAFGHFGETVNKKVTNQTGVVEGIADTAQ